MFGRDVSLVVCMPVCMYSKACCVYVLRCTFCVPRSVMWVSVLWVSVVL